jgi:cytochrome c553
MLKHVSLLVFVAGLAGMTAVNANESAPAADPAAYTQKLAACGACHGEKGDKPLAPDYPVLAGQHADYIVAALRHYRDGRRNHPIMSAQVKPFSRKELELMANYIASLPGDLQVVPESRFR